MPGGSGPSTCSTCKGDLGGVSFPGDGIEYPNDRNFFKVTVDDLLILLANFGQTCEDPSSVPDSVDSGGPSIVPIATGPTGPTVLGSISESRRSRALASGLPSLS